MNRREVMISAAGTIAALSFEALGETPKAAAPAGKYEYNTALFAAAQDCVRAGTICLDHCVRLLSTGDKSMAECAATVRAMLPLCTATSELALQKSAHLKALAAVCAKACRDCEAACKKHAMHHAECKGCMESCAACATECEKAAA